MFNASVHIGVANHQFQAEGSASLLDAALGAALPVTYSCKRGDCGLCLASLLRGDVEALDCGRPLMAADQKILLCNAAARSDLELRLPYFPELDGKPTLRTPAKIHEVRMLSPAVAELVLRIPPTVNFRFLPGQFIRISLGQVARSYSLSNGPDSSKLLRMHIKKVEAGAFSDYLFGRAKEGDLLHVEGPHGHFFVRDSAQYRKTVFLATGTGIAPVFAILTSLTASQRERLGQIHVYWGNRSRDQEYLADNLEILARNAGLQYKPVRSREAISPSQRYVQDFMRERHPDLAGAGIFACGNRGMIESARAVAADLGMDPEFFHADAFTAS